MFEDFYSKVNFFLLNHFCRTATLPVIQVKLFMITKFNKKNNNVFQDFNIFNEW